MKTRTAARLLALILAVPLRRLRRRQSPYRRRIPIVVALLVLAAAFFSACANLNERRSLGTSVVPQTSRGYIYGRFKLNPGSETQPRLFLQLTNVGTGEFLTIRLRRTAEDLYLIDVLPGRYQFSHLLFVPLGATEMEVRRDPLFFPPQMGFLGYPFDVEAGRASYVGDWVGLLSQKVDFYVVFSKIKRRWGIYRLAFDYEGATAELRRLYPDLSLVETRPAWRN